MSDDLAEMRSTWREAWDATQARIEGHPDFRRLIREVAIAEQPLKANAHRYRLNSPTYGLWITRGMDRSIQLGYSRPRARALTTKIAREAQVLPTLPAGEGEGRVWGAAAEYVHARLRGPKEESDA